MESAAEPHNHIFRGRFHGAEVWIFQGFDEGSAFERQFAAMEGEGIPRRNRYVDKQSGKNFDRPAYRRLLRRLRLGDLLVVKNIDRLGRNYREIIEQ